MNRQMKFTKPLHLEELRGIIKDVEAILVPLNQMKHPPRPASDVTRPASDVTRPASDVTRPASDVTRPASDVIVSAAHRRRQNKAPQRFM